MAKIKYIEANKSDLNTIPISPGNMIIVKDAVPPCIYYDTLDNIRKSISNLDDINTQLSDIEQQQTTQNTNIGLKANQVDLQNEITNRTNAVSNEKIERQAEVAVERARIDNFASLESGSTTGDAELIDARVGADGVAYANAGTAIRSAGKNITKLNILCGDYYVDGYVRVCSAPNNRQAVANWGMYEFIPIVGGQNYYANYNSHVVFYDSSKTAITSGGLFTPYDTGYPTTDSLGLCPAPANAKYASVSILAKYQPTFVFAPANLFTDYYDKETKKDDKLILTANNFQREAKEKIETLTGNKIINILDDTYLLQDGTVYLVGQPTTAQNASGWGSFVKIPIKPNTDIFIKFAHAVNAIIYSKDGTYIGRYITKGENASYPTLDGDGHILSPARSAYITLTFQLIDLDSAMLLYSSTTSITYYQRNNFYNSKLKIVKSNLDIDLEKKITVFANKDAYSKYLCNVLCIGDSLTEGDYGSIPAGTPNVHSINYPYFLKKLTGTEIYNHGKSGYTSEQWLANEWANINLTINYDFIIILLGTNGGVGYTAIDSGDVQKTSYKTIIDNCKANFPNAHIFLSTVPLCDGRSINFYTATNPAIESIATEYSLPVIDIYNNSGMDNTTWDTYQPIDHIHYGKLGYLKLANFIVNEITDYISSNYADFS